MRNFIREKAIIRGNPNRNLKEIVSNLFLRQDISLIHSLTFKLIYVISEISSNRWNILFFLVNIVQQEQASQFNAIHNNYRSSSIRKTNDKTKVDSFP